MKIVTSGCYFLYNKGVLVYVGESNNIFGRIGEHIRDGSKEFDEFDYIELNEVDRKSMEAFLIEVIKPKYNLIGGTNKIKIQKKISNFDNDYKNFCISFYENIEKNIDIKRIEEILDIITYPRLMLILENMKAPLIKDNITNHYFVEKQWLCENLKELYKEYHKYLKE